MYLVYSAYGELFDFIGLFKDYLSAEEFCMNQEEDYSFNLYIKYIPIVK